jgi:hypothetical protein
MKKTGNYDLRRTCPELPKARDRNSIGLIC